MSATVWQHCLDHLEADLTPQQFNTWVRPLHAVEDGPVLHLFAPNNFVRDWVVEYLVEHIKTTMHRIESTAMNVTVQVGSRPSSFPLSTGNETGEATVKSPAMDLHNRPQTATGLQPNFTFENFVEGNSNQIARAASMRVASNPGDEYNPLFIYGGVGLGKTHLMHAIGNRMLETNPRANVVYMHSERFVDQMVTALRHNTISDFKKCYRSVDALLIDDIQFFARKERSQDEFFHTYNALLEREQLVVLTCDRYPNQIDGIDKRLTTRFGSGLSVAVEPPELETRVAILMNKAASSNALVPDEVAHFIAQKMQSNVRELEGALSRIIATAEFTGRQITVETAREALRDQLALQERLITIENIQRTVGEYFKVRIADLTSKKKRRSIVRPRQLAMALAKELTKHSLPEIGDAFGGRDHTTVLHACRKVAELLREGNTEMTEANTALRRILTT